jgi:hypothetical protein
MYRMMYHPFTIAIIVHYGTVEENGERKHVSIPHVRHVIRSTYEFAPTLCSVHIQDNIRAYSIIYKLSSCVGLGSK